MRMSRVLPRRARTALVAVALLATVAACGSEPEGSAFDTTAPTVPSSTASATPDSSDDPVVATTPATDTPAGDAPATTAEPIDLSGVTLRVGDQVRSVQTLLEASGQLDGVEYDIEWTAFSSGPPLLEALGVDAIDIGGVGDTPPIFAQAAGAPIVVVSASKGTGEATGILVRPDSGITSVAALAGKRVAFVRGSNAQAYLILSLRAQGLGLSDIETVELQPGDALAAFGSGDIDAWAVWDPFLALGESVHGGQVIERSGGIASSLTFQVTSENALANPAKQAAIADFLSRIRGSAEWRDANAESWSGNFAELTGLPPEISLITIQHSASTWVPIDDAVIEAQQRNADALFAAAEIPVELDVAEVLDPRFNDLAPS